MAAPTSLTAVPVDPPVDPPDTAAASLPAAYPSDAPLRQRGTRTRSGNAMERTRSAILAATLQCLATDGVRKTTMGEVSAATGIAKATLYNHFRTKPDLLAALVDDQVAALAAACTALASGSVASPAAAASPAAGRGARLDAALIHAGTTIAGSASLRRVAAEEPALLLPLLVPGPGRAWFQSRAAVGDVLLAAGVPAPPQAVEAVLRWLAGQLLWPIEPALLAPSAALLSAGICSLPPRVPEPEAVPVPVSQEPGPVSEGPGSPGGLGWPG